MNNFEDKTNDIIKDFLEFRKDEINSNPDSNDKKYYNFLDLLDLN